jgi:hypothetical protein
MYNNINIMHLCITIKLIYLILNIVILSYSNINYLTLYDEKSNPRYVQNIIMQLGY